MGLEKYRTPEPVIFELEGEEFRIVLPTKWNKPYTRTWQDVLAGKMQVGADGTTSGLDKVNPLELMEAQRVAFAEHCVVDGPILGDDLRDNYGPLLEILFDAATAKANEEEDGFNAAVGKFLTTSAGKKNGKAGSISMTKSSRQGESRPPM
jgi:hypothetical protein